jgi:7-cyano-7-deazaguanine reductase
MAIYERRLQQRNEFAAAFAPLPRFTKAMLPIRHYPCRDGKALPRILPVASAVLCASRGKRCMMAMKTLQLGRPTPMPASPDLAVLDRVKNPQRGNNYVARFTFPEFTVMCPVTGQPDFATLVIDYVPKDWLVESKSLKLYLNSFRNHGAFHEDCTVSIGKKIVGVLKPNWLRIGGYFHPRGGMPIDVFWQAGKLPAGVWVPDQGIRTYQARS